MSSVDIVPREESERRLAAILVADVVGYSRLMQADEVFTARAAFRKQSMPALTEDTVPIRRAIAYVIELYRELTAENGAPSLGTQNQVVEFILADPSCARQSRNGVKRPTRMRRRPSHSGACPVTRHTSAPGPISGG
jgi:hypothetical protein